MVKKSHKPQIIGHSIRKMRLVSVCYLLLLTSLSLHTSAQVLQDPTRPVTNKASGLTTNQKNDLPILSAIIDVEGIKTALFKTRTKQVGQTISGYKILKIEPTFVLLVRNNKYYRLDLFPVVSKLVSK